MGRESLGLSGEVINPTATIVRHFEMKVRSIGDAQLVQEHPPPVPQSLAVAQLVFSTAHVAGAGGSTTSGLVLTTPPALAVTLLMESDMGGGGRPGNFPNRVVFQGMTQSGDPAATQALYVEPSAAGASMVATTVDTPFNAIWTKSYVVALPPLIFRRSAFQLPTASIAIAHNDSLDLGAVLLQ